MATKTDRLLDAHVEFVLAQLDDGQLADTLADVVDDLLAVAASVRLDALDLETVQAIALRVVRAGGSSSDLAGLLTSVADAVYAHRGEYRLGDVVDRAPVEKLVAQLIGMKRAQDRALERFAESPLVGVVAAKFVSTIIGDFVQQNRARAEKLPGMSSLFSIGQSAASRMPGMNMLSDAAGKGAQFAVKSTKGAMRDMMRDAPLQGAAMELWDLHADEPVADLREYLSKKELRELVLIVHELLVSARDSELTADLVDLAVSVFFDVYGDRSLAALLAELGLDRDALLEDATRLAPTVLAAARADGTLERAVRNRLEPFYRSPAAKAIIEPAPRKG